MKPRGDEAQCYYRHQGHTVVLQGLCVKMIRKIQDGEDYPEETEDDL